MLAARLNAPSWKVIVAFALIYIIWGSSYLGIHVALESFPPFFSAAARFLIAGSVLFVIVRRNTPAPTRNQWRSAIILGFFMFFIGNGSLMWAQTMLSSGMAATLYATVPMAFGILGWLLFGQPRPAGRGLVGMIIGFLGVIVLVGPGDTEMVNPIGVLLIFCSTLGWSGGSLLSRRMDTPASATLGAAMNLLVSGIMLMLASGFTGEFTRIHAETIAPQSVIALFYLALGPSLTAFSAYMWLLSVTSPARVSTYAYVNPVVAVFLGWAILGEQVTAHTLIASAIILFGVILMTTYRAQPVPAEAVPSLDAATTQAKAARATR